MCKTALPPEKPSPKAWEKSSGGQRPGMDRLVPDHLLGVPDPVEVQVRVGPMVGHGVELQPSAGVRGVVPAQRQAAAETGHGCDVFIVIGLVGLHRAVAVPILRLGRRVQVRPDPRHGVQRDAPAGVRDPDHDGGVVAADDCSDRPLRRLLFAVPLGDCSQRVFQQLEHDVVQVLPDKRESDLPHINHVHGRSITVVVRA
mmetsp:Transcript_18519/g.60168  ORF Transcript_18519/g.60168 Transcript_18519/m.60168 type:complete len:200 (-) Transcript_18519:956-1555(-)